MKTYMILNILKPMDLSAINRLIGTFKRISFVKNLVVVKKELPLHSLFKKIC
jgi:hypothetical protein